MSQGPAHRAALLVHCAAHGPQSSTGRPLSTSVPKRVLLKVLELMAFYYFLANVNGPSGSDFVGNGCF